MSAATHARTASVTAALRVCLAYLVMASSPGRPGLVLTGIIIPPVINLLHKDEKSGRTYPSHVERYARAGCLWWKGVRGRQLLRPATFYTRNAPNGRCARLAEGQTLRHGASAGPGGKAALGVVHLGLCCRCEVDADHVGQQNQVQQDVRHLLADPVAERLVLGELPRLGRGQPLKQFSQLAHLADEREQYRLRIVEPAPVPVVGELPHAGAEDLKIGHAPSIPRHHGWANRNGRCRRYGATMNREGPFWDVMEGRAPLPPAAALLGWELISIDPDAGTIEVAYRADERFLNPVGVIQGGFLTAMLDEAMR